ncbi:MAG: SpoIIIAH-like family protein [Clostridia bacterium]|nr:SpoIIIAH-like family protein [Clostridia bacterium]
MKEFTLWKKIKEYEWKKLLNTKNYIILGCLALVGVAVIISSVITAPDDADTVGNESNKVLGNTVLADGTIAENSKDDTETDADTKNDFFASAILNREQTRDESMEVLNQLANNPDALPDTKEDALNAIAQLVEDMNAEANIETLVKAKGFEECVAIVSDENCTVIVSSGGLNAAETAMILEIVCQQTDASPENVKIIGKQ